MSNRQDRKARKQAQRDGEEVFVHTKPQKRKFQSGGPRVLSMFAPVAPISNRERARRRFRYQQDTSGTRKADA